MAVYGLDVDLSEQPVVGRRPASEDFTDCYAWFTAAAVGVVGVQDHPDLEMGLVLAVGVALGLAGAGLGAVAYWSVAVGHVDLRQAVFGRGILIRSAT